MHKFISVLIVDDHSVFREGVVKIISSLPEVRYCDEAENGKVALDKLSRNHFDIVTLDISMPVMNGIETAFAIKKDFPETKIIMFSMYNEGNQVVELINLGIDAYILKSAYKDEIIKAFNHVAMNSKYFTPEIYDIWQQFKENIESQETLDLDKQKFSQREKEIINLLCKGKKAKQISEELFVSYNTICTHRANIMKKMEVHNIAGLINYAIENKLITSKS